MPYASNFIPMAIGAYGAYRYIKSKAPYPKRTPISGYSTRPNLRGGKGQTVNIYKTTKGLRGTAAQRANANYKIKLQTPVSKTVNKSKHKHKFRKYLKF